MTLRINILGFEVARVDLDMGERETPIPSVTGRVVHTTTKWWLKGLFR